MKKTAFLISFIAALTLIGCSSDEPIPTISHDESTTTKTFSLKRTEAEAIEIAIKNMPLLEDGTTKSRTTLRTIKDVSVLGSQVAHSRSNVTPDTLIYVVNFDNDEGFAVVPALRTADELLAICEKGNYDVSTGSDCPGMELYMDYAKNYVNATRGRTVDSLKVIDPEDTLKFIFNPWEPEDPDPNKHPWETKEEETTTKLVDIAPRVKVQWGQNEIYGQYADNYNSGCGPTAMAQVMSMFKYPQQIKITYNGLSERMSLNWDLINTHINTNGCKCSPFSTIHTTISKLFRQLGHYSNSYYDKKTMQTSTHPSDIRATLVDHGFNVTIRDTYQSDDFCKISNGVMILYCFKKDGSDGHTWLLDGAKKYKITHTCFFRRPGNDNWEILSEQKYNLNLVHYNWGWDGLCNGWFNDCVFKPTQWYEFTGTDMKLSNQNFGDFHFKDIFYMIVTCNH